MLGLQFLAGTADCWEAAAGVAAKVQGILGCGTGGGSVDKVEFSAGTADKWQGWVIFIY